MEGTFDAKKPLPRLCPVDVPVLFGSTASTSDAASTGTQGGNDAQRLPNTGRECSGADKDEPVAEEDQHHAVCKEMDACMRVLEDIKPKVRRIAEIVFDTYLRVPRFRCWSVARIGGVVKSLPSLRGKKWVVTDGKRR